MLPGLPYVQTEPVRRVAPSNKMQYVIIAAIVVAAAVAIALLVR